ncbi:hypothetical protein VYU27_008220 [Nannochloropsis oceanica]
MGNGKKKNKNKGSKIQKPISGQVPSAAGGMTPSTSPTSLSKDTSAAAKKATVEPPVISAIPPADVEKKADEVVTPASFATRAVPLKPENEGEKESKEGNRKPETGDPRAPTPSDSTPSASSSSSDTPKPAEVPTAPNLTPASIPPSSSSTIHPLSSSSSSSSETGSKPSPMKSLTSHTAEEIAALPIPPPLRESDVGAATAAAAAAEKEGGMEDGVDDSSIRPASPSHLRPESTKTMLQEGQFTLKMVGSRLATPPGSGSSYTEYMVKCCWGFEPEHAFSWIVAHRYSDFAALDLALRAALPPSLPPSLLPLPPRERFWVDSNGPAVVTKRRKGLEEYLLRILSHVSEALPSPTLDAFFHLTARIDRIKQTLGRPSPPPSSPSFFAYNSPIRSTRAPPSNSEQEGGGEGGKERGRVILPTYVHSVDLRRLSSTAAYLAYETKSISPLSAKGLATLEGKVGKLQAVLDKIDVKKDFMEDTYLCDLLNELMLDWPSLKALTNTIQEEEGEEEEAGEEKEKGKALEALLHGRPLLGRALTCDTTLASLVASLREKLFVKYGEKE